MPARLFAEFEEVANVLVGPDFVAVGLHRAADWERLLRPVLDVVTDEFADPDAPPDTSGPRVMGGPAGAGRGGRRPPAPAASGRTGGRRAASAAWSGRGTTSARSAPAPIPTTWPGCGRRPPATTPSRRQVAANLLGEADPDVAAADWARLVVDPVRSVRRAAVDAVVDAGRPELRPLLETALADADAWVRWKALRGLAELGAGAQPGRRSPPWPTTPTSGSAWRWPPPSVGPLLADLGEDGGDGAGAVVSDSDPTGSGGRCRGRTTVKLSPPNSGGRPGIVSRDP